MRKKAIRKKIDKTYDDIISQLVENRERYIDEILYYGSAGFSGSICLDEKNTDENFLRIVCKFDIYPTFPIKIKRR